jgi:hypothetical protein
MIASGSSSVPGISSMIFSSQLWGCAQSARTPCADSTWPLPPKLVSEMAPLALQLGANVENSLEPLKPPLTPLLGIPCSQGVTGARKSAQNLRTPRTAGMGVLPLESGSGETPLPLQLCARVQKSLETLSKNLGPLFGPSDATYHSIGWEGVTTSARIARSVLVSSDPRSRESTQVCSARSQAATTSSNITVNP